MTVLKAYRLLGKLIEQGHARKPLCIRKDTFQHNCEEDGIVILPVTDCIVRSITLDDGNGCAEMRKDGTERRRQTAILVGESYDPDQEY